MEPTSAPFAATHAPWRPSPDEVAGILAEMRPIIADFAHRAAQFLANASTDLETGPMAAPAARITGGLVIQTY